MKRISVSFLEDVPFSERLQNIWYCVFFLRLWRGWLTQNNKNLKKFITSNTYMCIELNAHFILLLYKKLRNCNLLKYFYPTLFSSQACESFFRASRSMTSTFSTIVNFTVQQFINRVKRIQMLTELKCDPALEKYKFCEEGRSWKQKSQKKGTEQILTDSEIDKIIENAKNCAISTCVKLGIDINSKYCFPNYDIQNITKFSKSKTKEQANNIISHNYTKLDLRNMKHELLTTENIPSWAVEITDCNGFTGVIKKQTLCWLLTDEKNKLSSDRLKRVQRK